jgi:hypothetical protein
MVNSLLKIGRWILGILFLLLGLSNLLYLTINSLISFAIAGLIIPPLAQGIQDKAGRLLSPKRIIIVLVVLLFIWMFTHPSFNPYRIGL